MLSENHRSFLRLYPRSEFVTGYARASCERTNGVVCVAIRRTFHSRSLAPNKERSRNRGTIRDESRTQLTFPSGAVYDIELRCARQRWRRKKLSRLIAGRSIARRTSAIDIPGEKRSSTLHSRNENIVVVVCNNDAVNCNSRGLSPSISVRLRVHRAQCQGDRSLPVAER